MFQQEEFPTHIRDVFVSKLLSTAKQHANKTLIETPEMGQQP